MPRIIITILLFCLTFCPHNITLAGQLKTKPASGSQLKAKPALADQLKAKTGSIVIKNPKNKTTSFWKKNHSYIIKWDKFGRMPDTVRIILMTSSGTGPIHVIKKSSPNSGFLPWTIPGSIVPGHYKIVINASKTDIRGFSNTFKITRDLKAKPIDLSSKLVIVTTPQTNRKYAPGATIPISWETELHKEILNTANSLYFDIDLYDRNGVKKIYTIVKRKDFREYHLGGKRYRTNWFWNPYEGNSVIQTGQYKIKITPKFADKDPCGIPGFSGRFNLSRGVEKASHTLKAEIRNRYSLRMKSYTQKEDPMIKPPVPLDAKNRPQRARVGYQNSYSTNYTAYRYYGFVFRSQLKFPLERLKEPGKLLVKAELRLKVDGYSASYIHPRKVTCAKALYYMTGPWSGKCTDTPGYLIKSIPDQSSLTIDITQFAQSWYTGSEPNHGLLLLSWDESFKHESIQCFTWYEAELFVEYLRQVKK